MLKATLLLCIIGFAHGVGSNNSKLDPDLTAALTKNKVANIFIKFKGGNKEAIQKMANQEFNTRGSKISTLVKNLKYLSESNQKNALKVIKEKFPNAKNVTQFWVSNELFVREATKQLVDELVKLPEVDRIRMERMIELTAPGASGSGSAGSGENWHIKRIKAVEALALAKGNNGQGIVVGSIDSGVRYTHEALKDNFRADHGWFDALSFSKTPYDNVGHGTFTMALIAGGKGIGVAPGAQWMTCLVSGTSSLKQAEFAYKLCGQFMLCPTKPDGQDPDCDKAPHVVSNAWGTTGGGKTQDNDFFNEVIEAWKAVDIIPVFANGNGGPACKSIMSPGDQDVISVGFTNQADQISAKSASGPSAKGVMKPDVVAPGEKIRSAFIKDDASYQTNTGSSAATPIVAGVIALLKAQNPKLTYAEVYKLLTENADKTVPTAGRTGCEGPLPNNVFGHGIVNAEKALGAAMKIKP